MPRRELQDRGFSRLTKRVRHWLSQRRTTPAKVTPHTWRPSPIESASASSAGLFPGLMSSRQLGWRLVQAPQNLDAAATEAIARISQDPEVAKGRGLIRRFAELIRRYGVRSDPTPATPSTVLGAWLTDALSCGIPAVEPFCRREAGQGSRQSSAHHALEQRAGRGAGQQAEADQASDVRTRQLRSVAPSRPPPSLIHENYGRTRFPGEAHSLTRPGRRPPRRRCGAPSC